MTLVGQGVLAVTEGVPELDAAVAGTGDDLAVVGREGDGENVTGVADEGAGGLASGQLPETESLIPGRRERISTVRGDDLLSMAKGQPIVRHIVCKPVISTISVPFFTICAFYLPSPFFFRDSTLIHCFFPLVFFRC